jgi:hypothetical protein
MEVEDPSLMQVAKYLNTLGIGAFGQHRRLPPKAEKILLPLPKNEVTLTTEPGDFYHVRV